MGYTRYPSRKYRARRYRRKPSMSGWTMARKALQVATKVAGLVNCEWKYKDTTFSGVNVTSGGTITCLSDMAQGDDDENRSGNSVMAKSLLVRGSFGRNSGGDAYQFLRVIVFKDMNDENDTAPTLGNLLDTTTAGVAIYSPLNKDIERFWILADRTFTTDSTDPQAEFKFFHRFGLLKDRKGNRTIGQHVTFNGASATDTSKGHIYILLLGNSSANYPTFTGMSRFNFVDN